jgi:hypothetical protein
MVRPTEFMVDTENFNVALGRIGVRHVILTKRPMI